MTTQILQIMFFFFFFLKNDFEISSGGCSSKLHLALISVICPILYHKNAESKIIWRDATRSCCLIRDGIYRLVSLIECAMVGELHTKQSWRESRGKIPIFFLTELVNV